MAIAFDSFCLSTEERIDEILFSMLALRDSSLSLTLSFGRFCSSVLGLGDSD